MSSKITMVPAAARPALRSGTVVMLTRRPVAVRARREWQRKPESAVPMGTGAARAAGHEGRVEQLVEGLAHCLGAGDAVELLECLVPPDDAVVQAEHHQTVVERLEDVFVELAQPIQFGGLEVQLTIEAAVFERRAACPATAVSSSMSSLVSGSPLSLRPERQRRDGRALRDARHEVVDARLPPERHFLGGEPPCARRIVQRARTARPQPRRRCPTAARPAAAATARSRGAIGTAPEPGASVRGQQKAMRSTLERLRHAGHQPLAEAVEIEVGIQVARESDQRATVIVAVAVERPIERRLESILHGRASRTTTRVASKAMTVLCRSDPPSEAPRRQAEKHGEDAAMRQTAAV